MKVTKHTILFIGVVSLLLLGAACNKDNIEDFDEAYVHVMLNESNTATINSNRRDVVPYYIYYSSPATTDNLEVTYRIEPGNGLQENRDYQIITNENPLLFPSGIYQRPIQIRWMERELDEALDNTLKIIIESTNKDNVAIGLPGPAHNQSEFIIQKVNP